ncbi:hypothetical protein GMRT_15107 [Giardia muris]|uniref:Uncharacterized protein n=1 Tax=Giardia muris TaxID=5742 RepID=A0A4Z1T3L1_GIAMU|nr:hypothetical protein GMRT_15107 [Giardia muris]|eukprot:TNJ26981.1 hypothetical protein GMRT_15107 [Giardia muris]
MAEAQAPPDYARAFAAAQAQGVGRTPAHHLVRVFQVALRDQASGAPASLTNFIQDYLRDGGIARLMEVVHALVVAGALLGIYSVVPDRERLLALQRDPTCTRWISAIKTVGVMAGTVATGKGLFPPWLSVGTGASRAQGFCFVLLRVDVMQAELVANPVLNFLHPNDRLAIQQSLTVYGNYRHRICAAFTPTFLRDTHHCLGVTAMVLFLVELLNQPETTLDQFLCGLRRVIIASMVRRVPLSFSLLSRIILTAGMLPAYLSSEFLEVFFPELTPKIQNFLYGNILRYYLSSRLETQTLLDRIVILLRHFHAPLEQPISTLLRGIFQVHYGTEQFVYPFLESVVEKLYNVYNPEEQLRQMRLVLKNKLLQVLPQIQSKDGPGIGTLFNRLDTHRCGTVTALFAEPLNGDDVPIIQLLLLLQEQGFSEEAGAIFRLLFGEMISIDNIDLVACMLISVPGVATYVPDVILEALGCPFLNDRTLEKHMELAERHDLPVLRKVLLHSFYRDDHHQVTARLWAILSTLPFSTRRQFYLSLPVAAAELRAKCAICPLLNYYAHMLDMGLLRILNLVSYRTFVHFSDLLSTLPAVLFVYISEHVVRKVELTDMRSALFFLIARTVPLVQEHLVCLLTTNLHGTFERDLASVSARTTNISILSREGHWFQQWFRSYCTFLVRLAFYVGPDTAQFLAERTYMWLASGAFGALYLLKEILWYLVAPWDGTEPRYALVTELASMLSLKRTAFEVDKMIHDDDDIPNSLKPDPITIAVLNVLLSSENLLPVISCLSERRLLNWLGVGCAPEQFFDFLRGCINDLLHIISLGSNCLSREFDYLLFQSAQSDTLPAITALIAWYQPLGLDALYEPHSLSHQYLRLVIDESNKEEDLNEFCSALMRESISSIEVLIAETILPALAHTPRFLSSRCASVLKRVFKRVPVSIFPVMMLRWLVIASSALTRDSSARCADSLASLSADGVLLPGVGPDECLFLLSYALYWATRIFSTFLATSLLVFIEFFHERLKDSVWPAYARLIATIKDSYSEDTGNVHCARFIAMNKHLMEPDQVELEKIVSHAQAGLRAYLTAGVTPDVLHLSEDELKAFLVPSSVSDVVVS